MKLPVIRGIIDRRILVNYRIDPDTLARALPQPFRPKLVGGYGIGGICLIRLKHIRPAFLPRGFGVSSENAAHRIAVQLPDGGEGVFIPRRDTSSWLNSLAGGRIFPGTHHHSRFAVDEADDRYSISLSDESGRALLSVHGAPGDALPEASVFSSLGEASAFFEAGSLGYSSTADPEVYDGLELRTKTWKVEPLEVAEAYSGYFEDETNFPAGSTQFDCALLMRGVEHEWHAREPLCCPESIP